VIAGIAALTAGCSGSKDDDTGPAVKATLLTPYGVRGRDAYAYVAQEKGYFRAAGFDVTIEPGGDLAAGLRRIAGAGDGDRPVFAAVDLTPACSRPARPCRACRTRANPERSKANPGQARADPAQDRAHCQKGKAAPLGKAGRRDRADPRKGWAGRRPGSGSWPASTSAPRRRFSPRAVARSARRGI
jgi:hypothetical protein